MKIYRTFEQVLGGTKHRLVYRGGAEANVRRSVAVRNEDFAWRLDLCASGECRQARAADSTVDERGVDQHDPASSPS